jgi:hypothetical protein
LPLRKSAGTARKALVSCEKERGKLFLYTFSQQDSNPPERERSVREREREREGVCGMRVVSVGERWDIRC